MQFKLDSSIEEIVNSNPENIKFLMEKGIRCIRCGEPIWGTFYEAAQQKGFSDEEIEDLLNELNKFNS
jgi:methionine synthase II (cobalamin-independent)